jgi:hypothetical protein
LRKANADVLVEPRYTIETSNSESTITVSGYAATYKNFRPIKEEDVNLINAGVIQKAEVIKPTLPRKRN